MRSALLVVGFVVGCGAPPPQVVTGRVAPGFPTAIDTVKVTTSSVVSWHGNALVATAPVATDGTFRVEIPPMSGLRIDLLGTGKSRLVFPRAAGTIQRSFAIRANGVDFDMGMVRYVGDASTTPFVFKMTGNETECEDGHDANGAMCVDDEDADTNTCDEGDHEDGDDDGEHEDGDDDGDEDGEHDDGDDTEDPADGPGMGDAIAEHNFPADGCADDDGEHGDGDGETDDD
jgi:hypothetical protein